MKNHTNRKSAKVHKFRRPLMFHPEDDTPYEGPIGGIPLKTQKRKRKRKRKQRRTLKKK
jgi:hypothetical protein